MNRGAARTIAGLVALAPAVTRELGCAALLSVLGGLLTVLGYLGLGYGAAAVIMHQRTESHTWTIVAACALLASFAARWLSADIAHEASYELEVALRGRLADALARAPLGQVQRLGAGAIKKIVQDDVKTLHNVVADSLPFLGSGLAQPCAALLALGFVQWKLLIAVLLIIPIALLCLSLLSRDYTVQRERYNRAGEAVNAAVVEYVQGMPVVRAFDDGRTGFARFSAAVEEFTEAVAAWLATSRLSGLLTKLFIVPLPTLLIVAGAAVPLRAAGWISSTDLIVGLLIGTMPIEAVAPLMHLTNYINDTKAGAVRVADLLATPALPEPADPCEPADASVTFEGVRFAYGTDRARPALDGVAFSIAPGTVCALVGPSGSGKSTVARLIPRFYDADAGTVRVGGVDVRTIPGEILLRHLALVFQDPFLIDGTVAENIRLSRPGATHAQVQAAAEAAAAHGFITRDLPQGYDTPLGPRGARLSGGQRQRITIARAILSEAPIVILDEATAFADPENEAVIQQAIARLTAGRTVLVIAHRLHTIVDADQILVMDAGRILERGTHRELLAAGGRYARLWDHHERAAHWAIPSSHAETDLERAR